MSTLDLDRARSFFCDDANANSAQSYKTPYRTLNYMCTHRLRSLSLQPFRNDSVASDINIYGPQYRTFTELQDSSELASEQYYDLSKIWPEHGSYARKKDNILRKLCRIHAISPGGSVLSNMDSVTRSVKSQMPLQKPRVAHTNCRLVLSDITHDLSTYQTSYQLVAFLLSALNAHQQAWTLAGIRHGDVSGRNIMTVYQSSDVMYGILIDWDLDHRGRNAKNTNQTGTWPFMSAFRVKYPKKPCELADDIESFIHVIMWHALCYHAHELSSVPASFAKFLDGMYLDIDKSREGLCCGCRNKFQAMILGRSGIKMNATIFNQLLEDLFMLAQEHYKATNLNDLERFRPHEMQMHFGAAVTSSGKRSTRARRGPLFKKEATTPKPSTIPTPLASDSKPTLVLQDHTQLVALLAYYIDKENGWTGEQKTPDQFEELPEVILTYY